MITIIRWNARSLIANGQEFKHFIEELSIKLDVVCVQETWMKHCLDFVLQGYSIVGHDREEGNGGGCATFIKQEISYRILGKGRDQEYIVVGIWGRGQEIVIIITHVKNWRWRSSWSR